MNKEDMKRIQIKLRDGETLIFFGKHLPEIETFKWRYYQTEDGITQIIQQHILYIIDKNDTVESILESRKFT